MQTPPVHTVPFGHAAQALPPAPHWPLDCAPYGTQLLPLQQPAGHEAALQTQAPPTHCWPALHAGPSPQPHTPFEQTSPDVPHETQALPLAPH